MFKTYPYLFIFIVLVGCKEKHTKIVEYHENGAIEKEYFIDNDSLRQGEFMVYYPTGKIAFKANYKNDKYTDTVIYFRNDVKNTIRNKRLFYDNGSNYYIGFSNSGVKKQEGISNKKDKRIGKWINYTEKGDVNFIKEYKIIDEKEFTNQLWVMLPTGDTLNEGANIKYHFSKNKLKISDSIYCFFQTYISAFEDKVVTEVSVTIPADYTKNNFTPDFSNRAKDLEEKGGISVFEISSLKNQQKPITLIKRVDTADYKKTVVFYWKPKRLGKDTLRGFFKENNSFFDINDDRNKVKNIIQTQLDKKTYFELPIEVIKD